jgi:MYXO-CTERM domain-containing protein
MFLGAGGSLDNATTYSGQVDFAFNKAMTNLQLTFALPVTIGDGFQSFTFLLTEDNATLVNQTFTNVQSAQNYFTNLTLDLGSTTNISAQFTITGDGFGVGATLETVQAAPEPSTWALMLGGFGLLAFWRRRTRHARP